MKNILVNLNALIPVDQALISKKIGELRKTLQAANVRQFSGNNAATYTRLSELRREFREGRIARDVFLTDFKKLFGIEAVSDEEVITAYTAGLNLKGLKRKLEAIKGANPEVVFVANVDRIVMDVINKELGENHGYNIVTSYERRVSNEFLYDNIIGELAYKQGFLAFASTFISTDFYNDTAIIYGASHENPAVEAWAKKNQVHLIAHKQEDGLVKQVQDAMQKPQEEYSYTRALGLRA